ncbi:MAG: PEP-CTERM sorting domain-containing protein [Planctomycetota bacterium]
MHRTACLTASLASALCFGGASAQLTAEFVLVANGVELLDFATGGPIASDIYAFELHNATGHDIRTFELGFSGSFLNNGAQTSLPSGSFPEIGPHWLADSFFVTPEDMPVYFVNPVDTIDELSSPGATSLGAANIWVPDGTSSVLALLTVEAGSTPLNFADNVFAADAVVDSQIVAIDPATSFVTVIPEPASAALLTGLGLMAVRRRR